MLRAYGGHIQLVFIAVTQEIADLPLYSGSGYRAIIFLTYFGVVLLFLYRYARRIERTPEKSLTYGEDAFFRISALSGTN